MRAVLESRPARRCSFVLVEPHEDTRELYAEYFERLGMEVIALPEASRALRLVAHGAPDAVVTCLRLPGLDGFELCARLQGMTPTRRLPVIALSTWGAEFDRAARDTRFAAVLMKPCLPQTVLDSVRRALAAARHGVPLTPRFRRPRLTG